MSHADDFAHLGDSNSSRSMEYKALPAAFAAAQAEMVEPAFDGTGYHRNRYATLSSIRRVLRPVLAKHGLSVRHTVKALMLITVLEHTTGEWMTMSYPLSFSAPDSKSVAHMSAQGTMTYSIRNSLLMLFAITGDEEEGEGTPPSGESKTAEPKGQSGF